MIRQHLALLPWLMLLAMACSPGGEPLSHTKESMTALDDPARIPGLTTNVEQRFSKLPRSGKSHHVWSGYWWPLHRGGLNEAARNQNMSPIAKYDRALGLNGRAVQWEVDYNERYGGAKWAGHCSGLAAAGVMTQEPRRSVVYRGVEFSPHDIKALLVKAWNTTGQITGTRCNEEAPYYDESGRILERNCRDTNPATLHLALTNFLGLRNLPIIADIHAAHQVWNFPVVRFRSDTREISTEEAHRHLGVGGDRYHFNHNAAELVKVQTRVYALHASGTLSDGTLKEHVYDYILELDSRGRIIGGEWIGRSMQYHPDFIWRPLEPRPNSTRFNPMLDLRVIQEIHQKSL